MTITQCSECGGKVSTTAQDCPYCGAPVGATEVPIPSPPVEQAQQEASHLDGVYEAYYEDGQLMSKITYKRGEYDGPYEWYWSHGELMMKGTYKNGKKYGEWFEYGKIKTYPEHPGTVPIPVAVYAGVILLVAVGLPPLALVLAAAVAGAGCAWPVGNARVARSLVTYAGLHITLRLWSQSAMPSVPRLGPGSSAEEINQTINRIVSMPMSPPGNWYEVEWWFALVFLGAVGLTLATRPGVNN